MMGVGFKLIDNGGELVYIVGDRGGLLDVKHFAKQGFMLIASEAIHQEFTEFNPSKLARLL
jgi:hypothetical protein